MPDNTLPLVLVTEGSDREALAWLEQHARVVEARVDDPQFDELLAQTDALVVRTYTRVDQAFLSRALRLKVVGRGGVGLENIDVQACRRAGVEVVYTPSANALAVAEFVFGSMLRLVRPWPVLGAGYESSRFKRVRNSVCGRQLNEMTLGILGLGRIGKRVSAIGALGFQMRVLYNDLVEPAEPLGFPVRSVDKPTLLRESDVLTIHVDMRPSNRNLVGRDLLSLMKPSAILINAARGEVLDTDALAEALREKRIAGAAIDVYAPEPPPANFPLLGMDNVLLTPHIASRTDTAQKNMSWVVRDVHAVLSGQKPMYPAPTE